MRPTCSCDRMRAVVLNAATLAFNDYKATVILVQYTATGVCTITISSAQIGRTGRTVTIKDVGLNAATNNIIVETEGAQLIEGQNNLVMNGDGMSVTLHSDGTNMWII